MGSRSKRGAESVGYFGFALFLAISARLILVHKKKAAGAQQAVVSRSVVDAGRLASALHLVSGHATVVEFMDFQCPPCRGAWPRVKEILWAKGLKHYTGVGM